MSAILQKEVNSHFREGKSYYYSGYFKAALEHHQITLQAWDPESRQLARCWRNIGKCHYSLGEFQEALKAHEKALTIYQKIKEADGSYRTVCNLVRELNTLSLCHISLGHYEDAKKLYSQAQSLQNYELEQAYLKLSKYQASLKKIQKETRNENTSERIKLICKKMQEIHQENTHNTLQLLKSKSPEDLRKAFHGKDLNLDDLLNFLQIASEFKQQTYETTQNDFFDMPSRMERVNDQINSLLREFETTLSIGANGFEVKDLLCLARSLHDRGLIHYSMGQFQKALEDHRMAYNIQKRVYGENNPKLMMALFDISNCLISLGQYTKALKIQEQAIGKQVIWFNENDYFYAYSLTMAGICQYSLGKFQKAYNLHLQACQLRKRTQGDRHPLVAESLSNIGNALSALKEFKAAEEAHLEALGIRTDFFGSEHILVADSLHNLGYCYSAMENYKTAFQNYVKAFQIRKKIYGDDSHPHVLWSQSCINVLLPHIDPSESLRLESIGNTAEVEDTSGISLIEEDVEKIVAYVKNCLNSHTINNNDKLELQKNPSGFIRIQLPSFKGLSISEKVSAIRVHYWPPSERSLDILEAAHNHPRHFISIVIQGGYSHRLYRLDTAMTSPPKSITCRAFRILKNEMNKEVQDQRNIVCAGRANLIEDPKMYEVQEKSIVDFPRSIIHRVVEAQPSTLTINCVLKSKNASYFDVFIPTFLKQDPQTDRETIISDTNNSFVSQILSILDKKYPKSNLTCP